MHEILSDFTETDTKRGYNLFIHGQLTKVNKRLSLVNPLQGSVDYGMSIFGYDTFAFSPTVQGAIAVVPYVVLKNQLDIGFVLQPRPCQKDSNGNFIALNIPRGKLEEKEKLIELTDMISLCGVLLLKTSLDAK